MRTQTKFIEKESQSFVQLIKSQIDYINIIQSILSIINISEQMYQCIPDYSEDDQDQLINMILGKTTNNLQNYQECEFIKQEEDDQLLNYPNSLPAYDQDQIDIINRTNEPYSSFAASQAQKYSNRLEQPDSRQNPKHYKIQFQYKQASSSKKQKNSNTIKKIGRIILDNMKEYKKFQRPNTPVFNMLKTLSKHSKVGRTQINKRDKFNTYHLRLLVNCKDDELVSHNLRTTRKILSKYLRDNVLTSKQISDQNKILYLNTMKCSALRCINKSLAVRLQMSMRQ